MYAHTPVDVLFTTQLPVVGLLVSKSANQGAESVRITCT